MSSNSETAVLDPSRQSDKAKILSANGKLDEKSIETANLTSTNGVTQTTTPQTEPSNVLKSKSNVLTSNKDNNNNRDTVFTLKKWNLVAMWSWDVECEVCAICRTPLMGIFESFFYFNFKYVFNNLFKIDSCLKCQTDNKHDDCVGKFVKDFNLIRSKPHLAI